MFSSDDIALRLAKPTCFAGRIALQLGLSRDDILPMLNAYNAWQNVDSCDQLAEVLADLQIMVSRCSKSFVLAWIENHTLAVRREACEDFNAANAAAISS